MTRSLYTKFLLGYLVFGLLGFIFIATMSSEITYQYLLEESLNRSYDEAKSSRLPPTAISIREKISVFRQPTRSYRLSPLTQRPRPGSSTRKAASLRRHLLPPTSGTSIDGFDPTAAGKPLVHDRQIFSACLMRTCCLSSHRSQEIFNTYGYVVIHMPIEQIVHGKDRILNIVYITALVIFILSLIILLVFTKTVFFPLKKIWKAQKEYAAGNLNHTIKVTSADEMGYLC